MTEPDEALLWARGQNGDPAKPRTVTSSYRAGLMAHGYRAGQAASAERIKALEEALAKANRPTHFWASTDGEYGEICVDIESAIEAAVYEAPRGRHLVEVETWRRCQPIWAVVHLLTDEEQEALGVDTDWTILKCATEAEARAVLKEADR
jgi:hypothetical protein